MENVKQNEESKVRKYIVENPNKTIREMFNETNLKPILRIDEINYDENSIRIRFGTDYFMSLNIQCKNLDENTALNMLEKLLDGKCKEIRGI